MKITLLVVTILFVLLAPMPPGIAMNPDTGECGYFMGGDEYGSFLLPEPWIINYGDPIQNETGTHQWDKNHESIESFCVELGYTFVPGNMASLYGKELKSSVYYMTVFCKTVPIFLAVMAAILGIVIISKIVKKHKTKIQTDQK
jgi:hypothetical protein